jgi:alkanesulfonate monooxygenase SsuD/methylene tetrahydromethanopterin reductase-like flavin-dependent oxidoreductase (luciferase family)
MAIHPFRFGVSLLSGDTTAGWQSKVRQAADLGYDIVQVPDHLGLPAPFPALVSAAAVPGPRLGTFVLNAGFYRPALLARDVAETSRLLDGRLELGIGTGYNPAEFEEAGLPFGNAGQRIDPMPPLLLGASGERMLRLAAREADIVGFTVVTPESDPERVLADRIEFLRAAAGDRFDQLELNLFVFAVSVCAGEPDLTVARQVLGAMSDEQIRALPGVLIGSAEQVAETLLRYREKYGLSYFGVLETSMSDFAQVIERLR